MQTQKTEDSEYKNSETYPGGPEKRLKVTVWQDQKAIGTESHQASGCDMEQIQEIVLTLNCEEKDNQKRWQ